MTPPPIDDIRELAEAYVAGTLSPEQLQALEAQLRGGEAARLCFLAYLEVHAGLAWEHRGEESGHAESLPAQLPAQLPAPSTLAREARISPWRTPFLRSALALAAAACALVALTRFWLPVGTPAGPATVKASLDARWANGNSVTSVSVGEALAPGVRDLETGLLELVTPAGAVLLIEAPARFELVGPLHARLLLGSAVVRMPPGKSGFVMDLPHMRVTDLGTEFGASTALDGESRVQVFSGSVRADFLATHESRELSVGESLVSKKDGTFTPEVFRENVFVQHLPPPPPASRFSPGGIAYNRPTVESVRIPQPDTPVVVDADLAEWNRAHAFRSACLPPYNGSYFVEAMMMYDAQQLYIGAHVGDPEPMRNSSEGPTEFAGGSVIVRLSTDRTLGWPLKGTRSDAHSQNPKDPASPDSLSDRVVSMILSHDARTGNARLGLQYGFRFRPEKEQPVGWRGAYRRDADGRGYTLEYAIPWALLHCETDPPHAGDTMAALWMVHWSDADGRLCRGQLVEVTNPHSRTNLGITPENFFQNGAAWGRALYLGGN
jgi:hypothetical protein